MGFTFGEAAWASQVALSWQTTVIGDPLYQPFATAPVVMHSTLARENSPLIEWSFNRLINLDIVHGAPLAALEKFAKSIPVTAHSAVLTEKLAELEYAQNEIGPSIDDWTKALDRNPSPEQSIRIRLKLADVLVQQNRKAEALTVYRELALATPGYPGLSFIRDRVKLLQPKSPIP
jgi:tetratricopeptide (TPR) repeat protein